MNLPVLMYHKITETSKADRLTITCRQLDSQFRYLSQKGYQTISLGDLVANVSAGKKLPPKAILLSFDDGYRDNFLNLYPLLLKYNFKATIFITTGFIQTGKLNTGNNYLHITDIHSMETGYMEYALHTFDHKSYGDLSVNEIENDIESTLQWFRSLGVSSQPCFAYTYGAYPGKDQKKQKEMFRIFEKKGIRLAFRIGNRLNRIPLKNRFLIQRIEVRGDDSLWKFKMICKFGRKWMPF